MLELLVGLGVMIVVFGPGMYVGWRYVRRQSSEPAEAILGAIMGFLVTVLIVAVLILALKIGTGLLGPQEVTCPSPR